MDNITNIKVKYPALGVCGISCRLCPKYHIEGKSKCEGCKSKSKMAEGCPFINCAIKRHGIEFCWDCSDSDTCERWAKRREFAKKHDSYVCYQRFEYSISVAREQGVEELEDELKIREALLRQLLTNFSEGKSKNYYSVAATALEINELKGALKQAQEKSLELAIKERSKIMHSILDEIADKKNYCLRLRGWQ